MKNKKIMLRANISGSIFDLSEYVKDIIYIKNSENEIIGIKIIFDYINSHPLEAGHFEGMVFIIEYFDKFNDYLEDMLYTRKISNRCTFYIKDDNFDFAYSTKITFYQDNIEDCIVVARILEEF